MESCSIRAFKNGEIKNRTLARRRNSEDRQNECAQFYKIRKDSCNKDLFVISAYFVYHSFEIGRIKIIFKTQKIKQMYPLDMASF